MAISEKLKELGVVLPSVPPAGGIYTPLKEFGGRFGYLSGCSPAVGEKTFVGRLGDDFTVEQGQEAARSCLLNMLAVIDKYAGLDKVKCFVKLLGFIRSADSFGQQPQVLNGASQLLLDIFGEEAGKPARSAIGTNALPGGIAVEIEALIEFV